MWFFSLEKKEREAGIVPKGMFEILGMDRKIRPGYSYYPMNHFVKTKSFVFLHIILTTHHISCY